MSLTTGGFPDVSTARTRSDFEFLFNSNARTVVRIRYYDTESGNYGASDEEPIPDRDEIQLNLQGISTDAAGRAAFGLSVAGSVYHAYAKHDEDIKVTDLFEYNGTRYKVENLNKSNKMGETITDDFDIVFQEFDMVQISTSTTYVQ